VNISVGFERTIMHLVVKVFGRKVVEATLTIPVDEEDQVVDTAVKKVSRWWSRKMIS